MQSERLTLQELTWLLTQEARSAAEKLRKGVAILAAPEPTAPGSPRSIAPSVEPELEALDNAMQTLASLHTGGSSRGRRGRIDLASLLYEVAPSARVSIEPGSGTEVFGDESELRRMLQVLAGSTSPAGGSAEMGTPELSIRREGSEIRVSVTLGPDSSANAETERVWLGRMAMRYGGRFELEGGTESIYLPAEGATEQREVDALRRELEAAQRQGEAYARELAAAFPYEPTPPPPRFTSRPADAANAGLAAVAVLASATSRQLELLHGALERAGVPPRTANAAALAEPIAQLHELVSDLARIGQCPSYESTSHLNIAEAVRNALSELNARATRRRVSLKSHIPPHADVNTRPIAASLLVRTLIADAIAATPAGGEVRIGVDSIESEHRLLIEDGGAPWSVEAPSSDSAEAPTVGRHATAALSCAQLLARHIRVELEGASEARADGRPQGSRLTLRFDRA
ncbi:MAG TPA: sensor histidine kinase [Polyangiaceae bacterium]